MGDIENVSNTCSHATPTVVDRSWSWHGEVYPRVKVPKTEFKDVFLIGALVILIGQ